MKSLKNYMPFYKCPRYSKCSVNDCPLHPTYPDLPTDDNDSEKKCDIAKSIRVRVAADFPGILKFDGLTVGENKAKKRFENMSPESKAKMLESLHKINLKRHLESNGLEEGNFTHMV